MVGKLKFEKSNWPAGVENPSWANTEVIRQEKETPMEASFGKTVMAMDYVSIAKIERGEASCSLTTERLKK